MLARALTPQQLNWQPQPGSWSIGQCLEHLHVANEVYLPPMTHAIKGSPRALVPEIRVGWLGRWFIRQYIEPDTQRRRRRSPGKIKPAAQVSTDMLDRFLAGNQAARDLVQRASQCDVNRVRFRNPFVPVLRWSVGTGLEILSRHQRRHLGQAERVRESEGFSAIA